MAEHPIEALLLEDLVRFLAHFLVHAREDLRQELNHSDLRAEAAPHAAKLKADHTAADDDEVLWHFGKLKRAGRVHDAPAFVVDLDAWEGSDAGAGGDHNVLGGDGFIADFDGVRVFECAVTFEPGHFVFLEQKLNPAGQLAHGFGLFAHHLRQVERRLRIDAPGGEVTALGLFEQFGGVKQRL